MAYFLGCDVCKTKIDLALVDETNRVLWQDEVPNDAIILASYLLTLMNSYPNQTIALRSGSNRTLPLPAAGCSYSY